MQWLFRWKILHEINAINAKNCQSSYASPCSHFYDLVFVWKCCYFIHIFIDWCIKIIRVEWTVSDSWWPFSLLCLQHFLSVVQLLLPRPLLDGIKPLCFTISLISFALHDFLRCCSDWNGLDRFFLPAESRRYHLLSSLSPLPSIVPTHVAIVSLVLSLIISFNVFLISLVFTSHQCDYEGLLYTGCPSSQHYRSTTTSFFSARQKTRILRCYLKRFQGKEESTSLEESLSTGALYRATSDWRSSS